MGKLQPTTPNEKQRDASCDELDAPICVCCDLESSSSFNPSKAELKDESISNSSNQTENDGDETKELVVIGSGPHALALMLRLLEPEADLMSERTRHRLSDFRQKLRPLADLRKHIKALSKGPSQVVRKRQQKLLKKKSKGKKRQADDNSPPIDLDRLRKSVMVIDKSDDSSWLATWKQNFEAIGITTLRSTIHAHADPYDHRALEYYSEIKGRDSADLIPLSHLTQRDDIFRGPYYAPSTSLFLEYHDLLAEAYGINGMVHGSTEVLSIEPRPGGNGEGKPYFLLRLKDSSNKTPQIRHVKARRVVCAMGPRFGSKSETEWETSLGDTLRSQNVTYPCHRILHTNDIVAGLLDHQNEPPQPSQLPQDNRLLVIGGGLTSAQLALLATSSTLPFTSVTFLKRSPLLTRQFDIENQWMGPQRGKCLEEFWSIHEMEDRLRFLRQTRKGGSIPPEIVEKLLRKEQSKTTHPSASPLDVKERAVVSEVEWCDKTHKFLVTFVETTEDGDEEERNQEFDIIWMATGCEIHIDRYGPLKKLLLGLPLSVVNGLPVLDPQDLSWQLEKNDPSMNDEPDWKKQLRSQCYVMGCLAALQLGPDALNLLGGRHGAVKIAKALRKSMATESM